MKKERNRRNLGFSLLELIVVISIMAVLGGVVAPQLVRHVNNNRATACRTDREAILAVYERCIYGQTKDLKTATLDELAKGNDVSTQNEVRQYIACPMGGNFSGEVIENATTHVYTAIIHCDHTGHEDAVVDFIGWSTTEQEEGIDADLPLAPSSEEPESEEVSSEEESSSVEEKEPTYWPYMDDARWDGKRFPGQYIEVDVPSGLITSKEGNTYVLVNREDGNGKFKVYWEWNLGPENIDTRGWDQAVSWSGVLIEDLSAFIHPDSPTQLTGINYGDIVVYEGKRYIYGNKNYGGSGTYQNYPVPGQNKNGFYLVDREKTEDSTN